MVSENSRMCQECDWSEQGSRKAPCSTKEMRTFSFFCFLNEISSALLPAPAQPSSREWYRHLTILGKDRILFINAALIEVPRAGLDFIFLFSFSIMDTPDTVRSSWALNCLPASPNVHRATVGRDGGGKADVCLYFLFPLF